METPLNHQCFEAACADLLSRLYTSFPVPLSLSYDKEFEAAAAAGLMPDHCKARYGHYNSLYGSTVAFLHREGVVHVDKSDAFQSFGVVLTSKGFLILRKPLESLNPSEPPTPLGEQFGRVAKLAGTEILAQFIGRAVGSFCSQIGMQ